MLGLSGCEASLSARTHPARAGVAQLVEQLIRNQQVIGSSPIAGSRLLRNSSILTGLIVPGCFRVGNTWGNRLAHFELRDLAGLIAPACSLGRVLVTRCSPRQADSSQGT